MAPVDEERYAAEFLAAHEALVGHGYEHYEVSNAARPGRRARHNSAYWRGPRSSGSAPRPTAASAASRRWNVRDWSAYDRAISDRPLGRGRERRN